MLLNSISLFTGAFGLDIGLENAGFRTRVCLDIDPVARHIVQENRRGVPYILKDIRDVTAKELLNAGNLRRGDVDLVCGGPPCQPFSKSGLRRGLSDDRGTIAIGHYLRILKQLSPRAFLVENVRGLYSSRGGQDFKKILRLFRRTGYKIYWRIVDAANYGVPQFRQRLFLVGFREPLYFEFPQETHGDLPNGIVPVARLKPFVTVEDAIGDLAGKVSGVVYRGRFAHLLPGIPEGWNYSYYCAERGYPEPKFEWRSKFWYFLLKIDRGRPSLTIQAFPGNNTGPFHWENRKLDIEELKRLQTFPDKFTFECSYANAHRLLGNAVPPVLAKTIGDQIRLALETKRRVRNREYEEICGNLDRLSKCASGRGSGKGRLEELRPVQFSKAGTARLGRESRKLSKAILGGKKGCHSSRAAFT